MHAVLYHRDAPATAYSTARHEHREDDPDDTYLFDRIVRFRGQRVAAVVAESTTVAQRAVELIRVEYEELPFVLDPDIARKPGAPLLHADKGTESRIADPGRNLVAELHGETGDVDTAVAAAEVVVQGRWDTHRAQHTHLETHGAIGYLDDDGRLVIRSSTQVPFLVRDELCHVFGLDQDRVRVFATRVGGGFGAKQEMLVEDVVAAAVLQTGRPVQFEFTRTDQLTIAPCRHPMRVGVTLAAGRDGILTALAIDVLSDAGAYGNHSAGVMFHGCTESIAVYRSPNKRVDAQAVYTNNRPSGAFRGYGLGQVIFAVESAMDELAVRLDADPYELRRRNIVIPGDPLVAAHPEGADLMYGSYGLDQCLDLTERAMSRSGGTPAPVGDQWRIGDGMALAMIATNPPNGHIADTSIELLPGGRFVARVGLRSSATAPRPCTHRSRPPNSAPSRIASRSGSPTPTSPRTTPARSARRALSSRRSRCCRLHGSYTDAWRRPRPSSPAPTPTTPNSPRTVCGAATRSSHPPSCSIRRAGTYAPRVATAVCRVRCRSMCRPSASRWTSAPVRYASSGPSSPPTRAPCSILNSAEGRSRAARPRLSASRCTRS